MILLFILDLIQLLTKSVLLYNIISMNSVGVFVQLHCRFDYIKRQNSIMKSIRKYTRKRYFKVHILLLKFQNEHIC